VEPTRAGSATRADSTTRARQRKKDAPLLSDEQLRTTAELTVRDLAAYARGEVSRAELSERAAQRASAPYRKALKTLKHSLGPAAHTMTDDAIYELVDIALAARQATQPESHQPGEPAPKTPARKKPAQKEPTQKTPVQKELVQTEPIPRESETPVRATSARPQKVAKASEEGEQKPVQKVPDAKKSAPEVDAEKPALKKTAPKKVVAKKTAPTKKASESKVSVKRVADSKTAAPKTTPTKASAKKTATKQATTKTVAADKPASAAAEAKSRALARYASEDRIENAPLKKYLPAPSAKAIATHLDLHTVGEMLEYFPRKYLPRGELSSFAELVEGQDVTIIARVVHVSTRTMAARRGKITEVTITDRLSDATGQAAPAGFGAASFGAAGFGAGGPVSVVPGRANRPGASSVSRVSGAPAQNWQATGMHNPRINALANSTQNPAAQNPVQGRGAQPASYSGYADSYGQDSFAQDSFAQDSFAQGGLFGVPAPSMTNPGALIGSQMKLSFFNAWTAAREIREGETMMFSGRVGIYRGEYTLTNPHYALLSKDASGADVTDAATAPVPVYRAPVKLPTDRISGYMAQLLEKVPLKELEDPVPYTIRRARKVPSLEWTYRALHTPDSEDTWRAAQAQMRYREAFVLQSALARLHSVRAAHLTQPRPAVEGGLADRLLQVLPYELTEGQQKVGAEIAADLSSESPMNRLLQGDVGSGKTVVALRAMLQVADAGGQSAMLAPTEVLAEQVSEREQQLHELSTDLKNAQEGLTSTNDEVQDLQGAHAAALTLLARTQTEAARVQERVQALAERARLVTGLTLEQLEEEYSEQLPVDVPADEASENAASENSASENTATETASETTEASTESVRARLKATRAELEALGAINPLALEEYEALSERHAYLNQQIEDLKATRRDLNTVMDEVSSHIAEVFTAAMDDINTHYRRIFETLFPGGEGHLELDDPSDPLNSGVEIHARPAGKKVKRLSLLSGGERSLASLALLIAIYMSRPSPFYALDEVEAALDDRNLSRLLQVIGELGERSQLIVVTHQKRTMQIAETLYGVSMRGGVSTVLSQQMEELRELL